MVRAFLAMGFLGLCGVAWGDDRKATPSPFADATFVADVGSCGIFEVELGKLAQKNATREDVKRFAQKMVDDHTKVGDDLKKSATSANITMPDKMSDEKQKIYDKFKDMKGEEFDREYIKQSVKGHEKAVELFTDASKRAQNAGLRDFAANTLPTLQGHLEQAKKLQEGK